jgi:hypothetical protein
LGSCGSLISFDLCIVEEMKMKQLLANALVSLMSGISLVLGIGGALWVGERLMREDKPKKIWPRFHTETLPSTAILETSVVTSVPKFTVRGSLKNSTSADWDVGEIQLQILSKGVVVNTCKKIFEWNTVKAGEGTNFLIECSDVNSPSNGELLEYRVIAMRLVERS